MLDFAQRAGKKGSGRGGRGVYQEETRRGEGHDEEGAAARPAVDAGKKKPSQGRRSRKGKQTICFSFSWEERRSMTGRYPTIGRWADFDSSKTVKDGPAHILRPGL